MANTPERIALELIDGNGTLTEMRIAESLDETICVRVPEWGQVRVFMRVMSGVYVEAYVEPEDDAR